MSSLNQRLSRLDLNLLVSLNALLQARSVSRAANMLYISQPAMSRTLQRLRDMFDDPLFYRTAKGIEPTARACELEVELSNVLAQIDGLLQPVNFIPAHSQQHFTLSLPVTISQVVLEPFLKQLDNLAPNIKITEYPVSGESLHQLLLGEIDFVIMPFMIGEAHEEAIYEESLGYIYPSIIGRFNHPLTLNKTVTLDDCRQYDFVQLTATDVNNQAFSNLYLFHQFMSTFNVKYTSSQLAVLQDVIRHSDRLMLAPHFMPNDSNAFSELYKLESGELPTLEVNLLSHKRHANSPAHTWLKEQLKECFNQLL